MTDTNEELLPCPFCGGKALPGQSKADNGEPRFTVRCVCCAAKGGWGKSKSMAQTYWNMRTAPKEAEV